MTKLLDETGAHKTGGAPPKLNLFATVWLLEHMEHIMGEDDKYARFIPGKPPLSN